jgi:hypothetical protein
MYALFDDVVLVDGVKVSVNRKSRAMDADFGIHGV